MQPIAGIRGCVWNVRFVPIATDAPQQLVPLFDHLVGAGKNHGWDGKTERFGRDQVNDQLKLGRLLDWNIFNGPSARKRMVKTYAMGITKAPQLPQ
jgi:hypothetical protein